MLGCVCSETASVTGGLTLSLQAELPFQLGCSQPSWILVVLWEGVFWSRCDQSISASKNPELLCTLFLPGWCSSQPSSSFQLHSVWGLSSPSDLLAAGALQVNWEDCNTEERKPPYLMLRQKSITTLECF